MSIQEPAWLKRRRPCPFFSQGRCLFADSCNFLHDVKVRNAASQPLPSAFQTKRSSLSTKPVFNPPSVVVNSVSTHSASLASSASPESSIQDSSRYSGLLSVLSDVIGPPSNSAMQIEQCTSTQLSSEPDVSVTLIDPFRHRVEPSFPKVDDTSQLLPVSNDKESPDEGSTPYFVQGTEAPLIGSGFEEDCGEQYIDGCGEENPTVMMPNRQSTFSSFTGASLLASPRNSVLGVSAVTSPAEGGVADLLSPVQLLARLHPFPILSLDSKVARGHSIDSGYADSDNWISPPPFPRSPPRSFQSPVAFLSRSPQTSHSFPALQDRRVSYDDSALRQLPHSATGVVGHVEHSESSEDNGGVVCFISGSVDTSSSEEHEENETADPLQVKFAEENTEGLPKDSTVTQGPQRYFPDHLHPIREHGLDSCDQPSDDHLSFKTALSTQPSCEDLSDISSVSLVEHNSLLSSVSGYSTPNTSVLSHYCDADDSFEHPVVGSYVRRYARLVAATGIASQIGGPGASEATTPEEIPPSEEAALDSTVLSTSDATDDPQVLAPQVTLPKASHLDRRSPISGTSVDAFRSLSSTKDTLDHVTLGADDLGESAPKDVVAPREGRFSGVFHFRKHPPGSSQEHAPVNVTSREGFPAILHFGWPCLKSGSSTESSYSPSSSKDVLIRAAAGAGDILECAPENVAGPSERLSGVLHFDKSSPSLSTQGSPDPFFGKDMRACAPSDTGGSDSRFPEPSLVALHDYLVERRAAEVDRNLVENSLGSDESSESSDLTQRLSFPLPPPFFLAESVGHSTLSGEDTSVLPEAAVVISERDASNVCTVLQHEDVQRTLPGLDLTEKASPNWLPPVGSLNSNGNLTMQRSRAASDLTVKGTLSSPPVKQPGRSDSVQSLYDHYFDDDTFDKSSEFYSSAHEDATPPDVPNSTEDPSQDVHVQPVDHTSNVLPMSSPFSGSKTSHSSPDSSRSESALRPLWTGRRSFLHSSLTEVVSKANPANINKYSFPTHLSANLQIKEIGSTMIPLGFRRHKPQPLNAARPASELREVLRIRTDITKEDSPPGCFSANHISPTTRPILPVKPMSVPSTGGLKQLCLSSIINKRSSTLSSRSSSITSSILSIDYTFDSSTPQSPSVSSTTSLSHNSSLSSSCARIPHTPKRCGPDSSILRTADEACSASQYSTHRDSRSISATIQRPRSWRLSHYRAGSRNYTSDSTPSFSRKTSTLSLSCVVDEVQEPHEHESTVPRPIQLAHKGDQMLPASAFAVPAHAIATPKPTLLFAIASDNVDQVRQVLESGEAGPNDSVGPQSALAFTLTNDKLAHKQEIVKALLAYGANPSALCNPALNPALRKEGDDGVLPPEATLEGMDPATRYFITRADAAHTRQTSQLIYRSSFRPLVRVRYDVIGQDWALEQLFRVLGMHSQKLTVAPIVVLLCGPSGHGKSLLARKFGWLLDIPTHTVNMTTLRSAHDIWQSYSMSPYEEATSCTLTEFLNVNEGKRCVVVLDEIEKVEDQKALWSLLMPWELGRCSLEAGQPHVDVRNVIWLGTSNVGHELVFEHHENRAEPDKRMSREDYLELTGMLRPRVSDYLGASLVSRVTTILPFVPFTLDEKKAIAAETVYALSGDASRMLLPQDMESLVTKALSNYHPSEGARSLHRAISNILVDVI